MKGDGRLGPILPTWGGKKFHPSVAQKKVEEDADQRTAAYSGVFKGSYGNHMPCIPIQNRRSICFLPLTPWIGGTLGFYNMGFKPQKDGNRSMDHAVTLGHYNAAFASAKRPSSLRHRLDVPHTSRGIPFLFPFPIRERSGKIRQVTFWTQQRKREGVS